MTAFSTATDLQHERKVGDAIAQWWACDVLDRGRFAEVDWLIERGGRAVAIAEFKRRSHRSDRHETVFISDRKLRALRREQRRLEVPALFVVEFDDVLRWINVNDIPAQTGRITGRSDRPGVANDQELMFEIPIHLMQTFKEGVPHP